MGFVLLHLFFKRSGFNYENRTAKEARIWQCISWWNLIQMSKVVVPQYPYSRLNSLSEIENWPMTFIPSIDSSIDFCIAEVETRLVRFTSRLIDHAWFQQLGNHWVYNAPVLESDSFAYPLSTRLQSKHRFPVNDHLGDKKDRRLRDIPLVNDKRKFDV